MIRGVLERITNRGVDPYYTKRPPVTPEDIQLFNCGGDIELPDQLCRFYIEFSNGFELRWNTEDEEECGEINFPTLENLARRRTRWINRVNSFANDPKSLNQCIDPEHRLRAFKIWELMKDWLPLVQGPEGDSYCIRLSDAVMVFDKHDWFDGFGSPRLAQSNGLIIGDTFDDFFSAWAYRDFEDPWFSDSLHLEGMERLEWPD